MSKLPAHEVLRIQARSSLGALAKASREVGEAALAIDDLAKAIGAAGVVDVAGQTVAGWRQSARDTVHAIAVARFTGDDADALSRRIAAQVDSAVAAIAGASKP